MTGPALTLLAVAFLAAGIGIGAVETAEHAAVAALAPTQVRGSASGVLAAVQAGGNFVASAIAGLLWTFVSPQTALWYLVGWMLLALLALIGSARGSATKRPGD